MISGNEVSADARLTGLAGEVATWTRTYPDFPSQGVLFQDLCPVLTRPELLGRISAAVVAAFAGEFDAVLAIEARGFVFGTSIAQAAGVPLVLARKPGKLPGELHRVSYDLEYGSATLEIQQDALRPEHRTLLVDDVLATGGTLAAAAELVRQSGGGVAGYAVVLTIGGLGGAERLAPLRPFSVITTPATVSG